MISKYIRNKMGYKISYRKANIKPYKRKDYYSKKAQLEGKISRAYYKLAEIDKRFRLLKPSYFVLDIGSYPGGWLEYLKDRVKFTIGVDKKQIKLDSDAVNIKFIFGDIFNDQTISQIREELNNLGAHTFDVVISDAMVKTTGIKDFDAYNSAMIAKRIIDILPSLLHDNGSLVIKLFQGEHYIKVLDSLKTMFRFVRSYKPRASKPRSREMYIICKRFRIMGHKMPNFIL